MIILQIKELHAFTRQITSFKLGFRSTEGLCYQFFNKSTEVMTKLVANLFWNDKDGIHRTHWVRWNDCCLPRDEGGLGLRTLIDISLAIGITLWGRFRQNSCLWAKFMLMKYCRKNHPTTVVLPFKSSAVWRRMMKAWGIAEQNIRWRIGKRPNWCKERQMAGYGGESRKWWLAGKRLFCFWDCTQWTSYKFKFGEWCLD